MLGHQEHLHYGIGVLEIPCALCSYREIKDFFVPIVTNPDYYHRAELVTIEFSSTYVHSVGLQIFKFPLDRPVYPHKVFLQ